ncbi:MAG: hypothetical protein EXS14_03090 [Planctomycetes bacterium]|nr:hypothetical protein [Planctomycetota bacterium]
MIPDEKALVQRLATEPFALIGINTDSDKDVYRKKCIEHGVTWRSSWQGSTRGPIPTLWNVSGYPTIFVLDATGKIRAKDVRGKALDAAVEKLLAEMKAVKN